MDNKKKGQILHLTEHFQELLRYIFNKKNNL